ncbi:DUF932 domain-containing protein [Ekhidna sp.]
MPVVKDTPIITHSDISQINFPVVKVETSHLFSDTNFADDLPSAIYSPDHNKVLSFCSGNYQLTENEELFSPVIELAQSVLGDVQIITKSYDDRRFYVDIIGDRRLYEVTKNDKICPMISIKNSYDGTVKQGFSLSYFRQICSNGMKGFAKEYSFESKHSKDKNILAELPILKKDLLNIKMKIEEFKRMADRQMTGEELDALLEEFKTSKSIQYPKRLLEEVPEIIGTEQEILKAPLSAWLVYNGFNNALMHADTKMLPEEKEKIDRRVLNHILLAAN